MMRRLTAALWVAGSTPARVKYLYACVVPTSQYLFLKIFCSHRTKDFKKAKNYEYNMPFPTKLLHIM